MAKSPALAEYFPAKGLVKCDTTDEKWERVKLSPIHRGTLRLLREEAVEMIEDGEFDG